MTLLRVEQVSLRLAGRPVLRGVNLRLDPGEVLGLVGPNGAGKTTLLRVATRVLAPDAGAVWVEGVPVETLVRRALARALAVVPQETRIPFPFTARELVLMGRAPHLGWLGFESREDHALAERALAELGIGALAERPVTRLSGGERQLALVARGFAQDARALLLDEPTASLDLRHRALVLERVRARTRAGERGALLVTHDLGLAGRYCDRLVLLAEGAVLAEGPPDAVLTQENLRRAYGVETEILRSTDGLPVVVPVRPSGC